ncbi:MAG: sulfur relay protein TusC/DsrF [Proteobacteria bacterium]|nr:sulfur relay protein TusC/DsrF [Pseudomonadota bacterium]
MLLTAAAFDQQVTVLFSDDGVFQLMSGQRPRGAGQRPFATFLGALSFYDVDALFVEMESLQERGLKVEQLVLPVQLVARNDVAALLDEQDVLVSC